MATSRAPLLLIMTVVGCLACLAAASKPRVAHIVWGSRARIEMAKDMDTLTRAMGRSSAQIMNMVADHDVGYDITAKKMLHACEGMAIKGKNKRVKAYNPQDTSINEVASDAAPNAVSPSDAAAPEAAAAPEDISVQSDAAAASPDAISVEAAASGIQAATAVTTPPSATPGGDDPTDLSLAFKLHSRPGAPRVLLLDFTGHTINSTNQWYSWKNKIITTPAYDFDGNSSSFSIAELQNIIKIWRAVAEDYSFADVDVTTEEFIPGTTTPLDLTNIGARAVIGGSSMDWYGASAGGVAYTGTFGVTKYDPAYIFPAQLGGGSNAKYIWEAVSHELGHRLGLGHDGVSSPATTYYSGHANWAPIMGCGYYKTITQFSMGEYNNSNNKQDDFAVMTTSKLPNGQTFINVRADDYGNSKAAAAAVPAVLNTTTSRMSASLPGNIEIRGDADWFSIKSGKGSASFNVVLTPGGKANVDMKLEVWAGNGTVPLTTFDTTGSVLLSGSKTVTIPYEGTWYVALTAVGDGANGMVGYTNYASLGEYKVVFDFPKPLVA